MSGIPPSHILIVEGNAPLREGLRQYLRKQGHLVSVAPDTAKAARLLTGLEFSLLLVAMQLPGARALCDEASTPVIGLVAAGETPPADMNTLQKPFEPQVLNDRIHDILGARAAPDTPPSIRFGGFVFDIAAGTLLKAGEPVRLTATEVRLMRIFAAHPGQPMGRGELVARLGREGLHAKARAVDVQITRLRRKIEADPKAPRHLQTVRGAGYMFTPA